MASVTLQAWKANDAVPKDLAAYDTELNQFVLGVGMMYWDSVDLKFKKLTKGVGGGLQVESPTMPVFADYTTPIADNQNYSAELPIAVGGANRILGMANITPGTASGTLYLYHLLDTQTDNTPPYLESTIAVSGDTPIDIPVYGKYVWWRYFNGGIPQTAFTLYMRGAP